MVVRSCAGTRPDGRSCHSYPIRGEPYCLWHSPDHEEEANEARRLGGLRRKREKTVAGAYEVTGLSTVEDLRRLLEIAVLDTLGLDNSLARARVIIAAVGAAAKLLEIGDLQARITSLEATRRPSPDDADEPWSSRVA
jgi:hypothetical protein